MAVVAADTREIAALEPIEVDYELLLVVSDLVQAYQPGRAESDGRATC